MSRKICFFLYLVLCSGFIGFASAQNTEQSDLKQHPICSSPALYRTIMETVAGYTDTLPADSILAKRHKALISANIESFNDVPAANFSAEDDVNTANALITIKVNHRIPEKDIIICRQNTEQHPVYVILYPKDGHYQGHILNLDEYSDNFEDISFLYP